MRCPNCNKFVSYDEPIVEEEDIDICGAAIQGTVRVSLSCAECGTELKENIFEIEEDFEHECDPKEIPQNDEDMEDEFEIIDYYFEPDDRYQTQDRNGKPIKNPRYMKHLYGFKGNITVRCLKCKQEFNIDISDELQASWFDECC